MLLNRFCVEVMTGVAGRELAGEGEADDRGVGRWLLLPLALGDSFLTRCDWRREAGLAGTFLEVSADILIDLRVYGLEHQGSEDGCGDG